MRLLSPRQEDVLAFIKSYISSEGYPPTYREIAAGLGFASLNSVSQHLRRLEKKGAIRTRKVSARAITVVQEDGRMIS